LIALICPTAKAGYFFARDWTRQITLKTFNKIAPRDSADGAVPKAESETRDAVRDQADVATVPGS
jgi:hypothetical protein